MFMMLGTDGNEYGPASVTQIKQWITEGRANLDTQLKRVGEDTWAPIKDLPEFSAGPARKSNSVFTPSNDTLFGIPLQDEAAPLDVFDCFDRSWQLFKAHPGPSIGVSAITVALTFLAGKIPSNAGLLLGSLITSVLVAGYNYYFLLRARGQPARIADLFIGFRVAFVPLLLVALVSCVLVFLGALLFLLPGIYLGVSYAFASILTVDKKLSFWDALETSRRVVTKQWWRVGALLFLSLVVSALGLVAFGIGVIFTTPIATGALVHAYNQLFRSEDLI